MAMLLRKRDLEDVTAYQPASEPKKFRLPATPAWAVNEGHLIAALQSCSQLSKEMYRAAAAALKRLDDRKGEDETAWADALGSDLGRFRD